MKGNSGGVLAQTNAGFHDQTLRQTVHVSVGGESVTVRLSNEFGTTPLSVGAAHVALPQSGSTITPATDHALTFGGASAVQIPAGGTAQSDPAPLAVGAGGDVTLSLYLPGSTGPATFHPVASAPAFVNAKGDDTAQASLSAASSPTSWFLVTGVQVCADPKTRLLVAFGDSITDGYQSQASSNTRWPDGLARRLAKEPSGPWAVVNAGISGNGLLSEIVGPSGVSRLSRDVFARGSVAYMIVLEGINDIGLGNATAAQLEAGYQSVVADAHVRGIHVIGATLLPFKGSLYYSSARETIRQAVNAWIRTSGAFDAVIDFENVVRDPKDGASILASYDSGDHLHPNSKGYGAMADAIDLALFK